MAQRQVLVADARLRGLLCPRSTDALPQPTKPTAARDGSTPTKPKKKRIRIQTDRRREQCRRNQARYRAKERERITSLETALASLRGQIDRLAAQQRALRRGVLPLPEAALQVVMTHTTLFAAGIRATPTPHRAKQLAFVSTHMSPHVRVDDQWGQRVFLEQALLFTTLFDGFFMALRGLEIAEASAERTVVRATVKSGATITPKALETIFPAVLPHAALKAKLTGAQLTWNATIAYEFNASTTIVGVDWTIDLVAAFCALLTLEETARVLEDARMVRESYLVPHEKAHEPIVTVDGEVDVLVVDDADVLVPGAVYIV
ncbi:hypothetical protein PINS_up009923 [Pythium insidiosum]|nr:hypothetical protein PINS_up009923 [Pythium insidiosum]